MTARTLDEIRSTVEALRSEIAEARWRSGAGLADDPGFAGIYERHAWLVSKRTFEVVSAAREAAGDEERARLDKLVEHLVSLGEGAAARVLEDRIARETAIATVVVRGDRIPLRAMPVRIRNAADRTLRAELAEAEDGALGGLAQLHLDRLAAMREAASKRVAGDYVAAKAALSGIDLEALAAQADRFLDRTKDLCRDAVAWERKRIPDLPPKGRLAAHDLARVHRAQAHDPLFPAQGAWPAAERTVRAMGLDPLAGGRIRLDLEDRPKKSARAFSAAPRVPDEVWLVVRPGGGLGDWRSTLHELGHALHRAGTRAEAALEDRRLGDASVTEGFAALLDRLVMDPIWLRRVCGIPAADVEAPLRAAATSALLVARRHAAKLRFEMALHRGEGDPGRLYGERMSEQMDVDWPAGAHGADVDPELYCARYVRSWMLEAALHARLRDLHDQDWFRNPRCGKFLAGLFAEGQRRDAARLAAEVGGEELSPERLADRFEEVLG